MWGEWNLEHHDRVSIFYFSGTGNTWWVARELAGGLGARGMGGDALSIEKVAPYEVEEIIAASKMVGFGYPIYGSDLPEPMKEFIISLPAQREKPAFVFCTQWLWSGDGARVGATFLEERGFKVFWGEHFLMPNNVCISAMYLPYTNDREKLKPVLARASRRIERLADRIRDRKPFYRGFSGLAAFSGALQRVPFRLVYPRIKHLVGIEASRCRDCGLCVKLCPAGNLSWQKKEEKIEAGGNCMLCQRCYCFCPSSAITYINKPHNLKRGKPYRGPVEDFDPLQMR